MCEVKVTSSLSKPMAEPFLKKISASHPAVPPIPQCRDAALLRGSENAASQKRMVLVFERRLRRQTKLIGWLAGVHAGGYQRYSGDRPHGVLAAVGIRHM